MPFRDHIPQYFLLGLIGLFLLLTIIFLGSFLAPLVIGAVLAGLSYNFYKKILKRLGNKETLSALLVLFLIVIVVIIPVTFIGIFLFSETFDLLGVAQNQIQLEFDRGAPWLVDIGARFNIDLVELIQEQLGGFLKSLGLFISGQIGPIFSNAMSLILDFFIILVTTFYLLRDGERLGNFIMKISPLKDEDERKIYKAFQNVGHASIYGNFVSALAQGVFGGLGFLIFGVGSPVLWGTVMGFLGLLPLLGPYLIFIPGAIYLMLSKSVLVGVGLLIYGIVVVSSIDNIIKPLLISGKVNAHPLLILVSVLGGLKLFGVVGLIYGPLVVTIFITLIHIYSESEYRI